MPGMEDLLMNDDDSSSGESDNGKAQQKSTQPAPVAPVATVTAPAPSTTPAPLPQSDVAQRLRNLYSPANKGGGKPAAMASKAPVTVKQEQPQQQTTNVPTSRMTAAAPHPAAQQPRTSQGYPPQGYQQQQQQTQQQQQLRGAGGPSMSRQSSLPQAPLRRTGTADPFEPTPVSKLMHPSQQHPGAHPGASSSQRTAQQQAAMHHRSSAGSGVAMQQHHPSSGSRMPSTSATSRLNPQQQAEMQRRLKREKETFLVFTRVLMKYLEQKDMALYHRVKAIIKECAERNRRQEPGYESVTSSMRAKLKEVVSETHWKRAEAYLKHFMKTKNAHSKQQQQQQGMGSSGGSSQLSSSQQAEMDRKQQALALQKKREAALAQQRVTEDIARQRQALQARQQMVQKQSAQGPAQPQHAPARQNSIGTAKSTSPAPPSGASTASSKSKGPAKSRKGANPSAAQRAKLEQAKAKAAAAASAAAAATNADVAASLPAQQRGEVIPAPIVKEYNEYMKLVDHAMNLDDWTSTGLMMGQSQSELKLNEEQRHLLYGDGSTLGADGKTKEAPKAPEYKDVESFPSPKWNYRNVVSARSVWAKIRMRERDRLTAAKEAMPEPSLETPNGDKISVTDWYNEDVAQKDKALALISEAAQQYLKGVLEKAVHCGRQRQNVDGVRLFHQQVLAKKDKKKVSLTLRLGCDVNRQVAQAQGNAAMTVKRMEEALERQEDLPKTSRSLDYEALMNLTSMSDAAGRPRLGKAVESADLDAKRSFEVYGGKEANEPPFGRLAKKPKLVAADFQAGINLPSFRRRREKRIRGRMAGSFYF